MGVTLAQSSPFAHCKSALLALQNGSRGAPPTGSPPQEGGRCNEGPLQGCELRLQREGYPGAVHGQLTRGPCFVAASRIRILGVQVRSRNFTWRERGFSGKDLQDVWTH